MKIICRQCGRSGYRRANMLYCDARCRQKWKSKKKKAARAILRLAKLKAARKGVA